MRERSKRYRKVAQTIDRTRRLPVGEAVAALKSLPAARFDETVEVAVVLGINLKKGDQSVRGTVSLPHGIGKKVRVIAFAEGEGAEAARAAGAIEVGSADLARKVADGWMEFDVAVASPDMMKHVGRLGKILGPHGKMPSPKSGTVTENVGRAVGEFVAGKIEFRNDSGGTVHAPVGKKSFDEKALAENIAAFMEQLADARPATAKGTFIQRAYLTTTMGPSIPLAI